MYCYLRFLYQRFDDDVDVYGVKISDPDPSQIDKYSKKYPLNAHNEGKMFPGGYFRKV
jgi:hypothetical protein